MSGGPLAEHVGPIAVRAYAPRHERRRGRREAGGDLAIYLDTETTTDTSQRLLLGAYRVCRGERLIGEGLFHADDLSPEELGILRRYVAEHAADHGQPLRLWSRDGFVEQVLWGIGYQGRALIVGHNLAFDLTRLAVASTTARNGGFSLRLFRSFDEDGVAHRHLYRSDVTVKAAGSKRQFISFMAPARSDPWDLVDDEEDPAKKHVYRGRFLDTHMAVFALTDRSMSLEDAARYLGLGGKLHPGRFGVVTPRLIRYCRGDVRLTAQVHGALEAEWARHPIDEPLEGLYSPASVGKLYLGAMGISAPRERAPTIDDAELGRHMVAYYGGRTECRIRGVPLPVRYVDLTSMYPTVFALLGLWRYVTAAELRVEDATPDARAILARATRERFLRPAAWGPLATVICRVRPDGALLPTRARYGALPDNDIGVAWTIGLNELDAPVDLWFTLADLVAAKLLGERTPGILEARRVVPVGRAPGLRCVRLRGMVAIDPAADDFFRRVIEERQRIKADRSIDPIERERLEHFLKILANATAYGIFAEVRTLEPRRGGETVTVHGLGELHCQVRTAEEAGPLCFPPFAATITGGARLLLALLQAGVEARGGSYVACDTDSLLIVSSREGGLIACPGGPHRLADGREAVRALSWAQVDAVLAELDALDPYDRAIVPHLVKVEDENYRRVSERAVERDDPVELVALAVSSKRYVLYERTPDGPLPRKTSRHGLGLYRPPLRRSAAGGAWIERVWERHIREVEGLPLPREPAWWERIAVSQLTASSPHVLGPFRHQDEGRGYADRVKPYGFLLVGHADPLLALPDGRAPGSIVPVAPYSTDPSGFAELPWVDRATGGPLAVTTRPGGLPGHVRLTTYRDAIVSHRWHPEHKSGDPAAGPCLRGSVGLLPRLHVVATDVRHIGKESNRLDEEEAGLLGDPDDDPYIEYRDERREWEAAIPALRTLREERGAAYLCEVSGLSQRAIRYALNGGKMPRREARRRLLATLYATDATPYDG